MTRATRSLLEFTAADYTATMLALVFAVPPKVSAII